MVTKRIKANFQEKTFKIKRRSLFSKKKFAINTDTEKLKPRDKVKAKNIKKRRVVTTVFFFVIIIPIVIFFFSYIFRVGKIFTQKFLQALGNESVIKNKWQKDRQLNLLIINLTDLEKKSSEVKSLHLLSFNYNQKEARILEIPVDLTVSTANNKGEYLLSKVYALGAVGDEKQNIALLIDTFSKNFAVNCNRYIVFDDNFHFLKINDWTSFEEIKQWIASEKSQYQGISSIFEYVKEIEDNSDFQTNLSGSELFLLYQGLFSFDKEKISAYKLSKDLWNEEKEDEGEGVSEIIKRLNFLNLDNFMQENFYNLEVRKEFLKVKIYNGANIPMTANKASRFVKNLGAETIEASNAESESVRTKIQVGEANREAITILVFKNIFGAELEVLEMPETERADLLITIGKDWAEKME